MNYNCKSEDIVERHRSTEKLARVYRIGFSFDSFCQQPPPLPMKKAGYITHHILVIQYLGLLYLVQCKLIKRFAHEASNLVGR